MSTADFWQRAINEEWATSDEAEAATVVRQESILRHRAHQPERIPDLYATTEAGQSPFHRLEFPHEEMWKDEDWWQDAQTWDEPKRQRARNFSEQIEKAFHYSNGDISVEWLVKQHPDDLATLQTGDYGIDKEVMSWVMDHNDVALEFQQNKREIASQQSDFIDRYVDTHRRQNGFMRTIEEWITPVHMGEITDEEQLAERAALREEAMAAWQEQQLSEMVENAPPSEPGFWSDAGSWVGTQFMNVSQFLSYAPTQAWHNMVQAQGFRNSLTNPGLTVQQPEPWDNPYVNQREEDQRAAAEVRAKYDSDIERIQAAVTVGGGDLQALWNDPDAMEENLPGLRQQQIEMFDGNEMLAGISFIKAGEDMLLTADEQVLLDLADRAYEADITALEDQDYQLTGWVLNALGFMDKYFAGTIGTGIGLFLSDEDLRSALKDREIGKFHDAIKENDYRPSAVFGLENTVGGFGIDMFASFAFDPTNILAPPGLAGAGKLRNLHRVGKYLNSGPVKKHMDEMINAIALGDEALLAHHATWIMENDPLLYDELVGLIGRSADNVGDVIGPGINKEQSAALRNLAENGVPASKGADEGVTPALRAEADARAEAARSQPALMDGDISEFDTWHEGLKYQPYMFDEGGQKGIVWKAFDREAGEWHTGGMVRYTPGEAGAGWLNNLPGDSKLVSKTIEIIRRGRGMGNPEVAELLLNSAADTSITMGGAKALTREIRNFVDETAGGIALAVATDMDDVTKAAIRTITKKALKNGAHPDTARAGAMAMAMGNKVRKTLAEGGDVSRYFQHFRTTRLFRTNSPRAYREFYENIHYIWGDNRELAQKWTGRLARARSRSANAAARMAEDQDFIKLNEARRLLSEKKEAIKSGVWESELHEAAAIGARDRLEGEIKDLADTLGRRYHTDINNNPIHGLVQEMWEDYNREVLAKMDEWAPYVNRDGLVPWEVLRGPGGTLELEEVVPTGLKGLVDDASAHDLGFRDADHLAKRIDNLIGNRAANAIVPLSPFDMVVAGTPGGAKRLAMLRKSEKMAAVREAALQFDRMWKLDKIARISTAAVVSFDELMRVWHLYGNEAAMQYMKDRGMFWAMRGKALKNRRLNKSFGYDDLSPAQQKRIAELQDIPSYISEAEMLTYERIGQAARVIQPGDPGYKSSAKEFYRNYMQDPGMQAALRGEAAFMEWWQTDAAMDFRKATALNSPMGGGLQAAEEWYKGYQTLIRVLSDADDLGTSRRIIDAMKEAAENAARGGNGYLDPQVFNYTPAVKGYQRAGFNTTRPEKLINGATEFMLDSFFMEPTNYRRGLMYNMAKKTEMQRLHELYAQQNIRVMDDGEFLALLGLPDSYSLSSFPPDVLDALATRMGNADPTNRFVLRRTLENRAGSSAEGELHNAFYAWDEGSRFGQLSRGAAPFGGPWADMWGFWGREMMSRPVLRGGMNEGKIYSALQDNVFDNALINPRALSPISRAANQPLQFEAGETEVDLSPLIFFPTQDENPLRTLLPGLGVLPMFLLDRVIDVFGDPVNDPEGYQELMTNIAKVIPQADFMSGNIVTDLAGGGNLSAFLRISNNIGGMVTGERSNLSILGNYSEAIELNRAVSAKLVPNLEDLLSHRAGQPLAEDVMALINQATRSESMKSAGELATRWVVPARVDFDPMVDELHEVWIDWARDSELMADLNIPPNDDIDGELARTLTADIRDKYFNLSDDQRELTILQNPALAINVVGNWEWSEEGELALDEEALTPYRSGGDNDAALRHQTYVDEGWIKPITPIRKAYLTLGVIHNAQRGAAKDVYSEVVGARNDYFYDEIMGGALDGVMQGLIDKYGDRFNITDPKKLWERLGSYEDDFEDILVSEMGIDPESDLGALVKTDISTALPKDLRAWGTTWTGTPRKDFRPLLLENLNLSDDIIEKMELVGIPFEAGLTGKQLHQGVQDYIGENPGFTNAVLKPYRTWLSPLGASGAVAEQALRENADHSRYDFEFRQDLEGFLYSVDNTLENIDRRGYRLRSDVDDVREKFHSLMIRSDDVEGFQDIWRDGYEDRFGPLEWEAPTPPELFPEGNLNSRAYQPVVREIVDGDTLIVDNKTTFFEANLRGNRFSVTDEADGLRKVRIIGLRARDYGIDDEGAREDEKVLRDALLQAKTNGDKIYLVTDPDTAGGYTDKYGRELAWLYIGDEPFYTDDAFLPTD